MVKNFSKEQKMNSMWVAIAYGSVIAILISLLGSIIGAILMNRELIGESAAFILPIIVWIASGFTGTMVAAKLARSRYLLVAGITALIYLFVLISVSILIFDGKFTALWQGIVSVLAGGGLSLILSSRKNTGKKHKVKYRSK